MPLDRLVIVIAVLLNAALLSLPMLVFPFDVGFLQKPATVGFYLMVSVFVAVEIIASTKAHQSQEQALCHAWLPYVTGMALLVFFWIDLLGYRQINVEWAWWHLIGAPVLLAGIGLRVLAIQTLNKHFVSHIALRHDHRLIQHGLYRWLRHPSELGLILVCAGILLWQSVPEALCFMLLVILPLSIFRIYREDAVLAERFPVQFEDYRQRTAALLPGLF